MNFEKDVIEKALRKTLAELEVTHVRPRSAHIHEPLPPLDSFDVGPAELRFGAKCKVIKVKRQPNKGRFWCSIQRLDGKPVRPGARGDDGLLGHMILTQKPERTARPSAPSATISPSAAPQPNRSPSASEPPIDSDTYFRAGAVVNSRYAKFAREVSFYRDFLDQTPDERAEFMRPLLAKSPMPNGDACAKLQHVKALLHAASPKPRVGDLIAGGMYAEAWAASPGARAEFTSLATFEAFHRNTPEGLRRTREAKVAAVDRYVADNCIQVSPNQWQAKSRADAEQKKRDAWIDANVEQTGPNSYRRKIN